jgi:hypothetical protein
MADLHFTEPRDYVLLHQDTGSALCTTRATEAEIHRANQKLRQAGQAPGAPAPDQGLIASP